MSPPRSAILPAANPNIGLYLIYHAHIILYYTYIILYYII